MTVKRANAFKNEARIAKAWAQQLSCEHAVAAWPTTLDMKIGDQAWKSAAVAITFPGRRLWAIVALKRPLSALEEHAIKSDERYRAFGAVEELLTVLGLTA